MPLRSWLETLQGVFSSSSRVRARSRRRPAAERAKARLAETLEKRVYLSAALFEALEPLPAEISELGSEAPPAPAAEGVAGHTPTGDSSSVRPHGFWYVPSDFHGDLSTLDKSLGDLHESGLHAGEAHSEAFAISGFKWPQSGGTGSPVTITYSYSNLLDGGLGGDLSAAQLTAAVEEALELWASVAPLHFVEVADSGYRVSDADYSPSGHADIRIGHEYIDGETGANVLAHAYYPTGSGLAGDVHFDNSNTWHLGPETGVDFLEVAVHELGHALGLGHAPMPSDGGQDAVMNPYYGSRFLGGLGHSYLLQDDIDGIQTLYGTGAGSVTPLDGGNSGSEDDHGNSPGGATPITVGSAMAGQFEVGGDEDWFSFEARGGRTYVFETTLVTAPDTKLELFDASGTRSLQFDDDSGNGLASRIEWDAPADGTVFLKVSAFSDSQIGTYTLTVSEQTTATEDDHGDTASGATVVAIGTTIHGSIETGGDEDYFRFHADRGSVYRFETRLGSLEDSTLAVFDSDGTTLLVFNDDGGDGHAASLEWTAPHDGRFYLRVRAFSANQTGTYELRLSRVSILGVPAPQSPSGTIATEKPALQWTAADNAVRYQVRVTNLTLNRVVVDNVDVTGTQYTPANLLTNGQSYRWEVRAVSAAGIFGAWSTSRQFTIQAATLGAPTPAGPPAISYDTRPTFAWSAVAGAVRYDLWVNDLTTGQSGVIRNAQITKNEFTPNISLTTGHRYLWCVRAIDAHGRGGDWSPHRGFIVTTPVGKPVPASLSGAQVGTRQTFSWTATPGAVRYDLWVNDLTTGQSGIIRRADITNTSWTDETTLQFGHAYVWCVRGINADGIGGEWSEHRWFTVSSPIAAPTATAPIGDRFGATQTFEWTAVRGAARYDLWVNNLTTREFAVIRDTQITSTRYTAHGLRGGHVYQWAVRGVDGNGDVGRWSEIRVFSVVATIEAPTLSRPIDAVVGTTQTFAWSSVDGAARYDLWVNDLTTGQSGVIRKPYLTGTRYTATTELTPGHRYIWGVRPFDSHDAPGLWSELRQFTVTAEIGAPTRLAPSGLTSGVSQTFQWSAVPGASRYDLWVNDLTTGQSGVVRNAQITENSYTVDLTPGHRYVWTVRAFDAHGGPGMWASHHYFTVAERLSAPTPAGPSGITGPTPTFEWSAVDRAASYEILVRNLTTGGQEVLRQAHVTATRYTPSIGLKRGQTYRWWVRAVGADGENGPWSVYRTFTVATAGGKLGEDEPQEAPLESLSPEESPGAPPLAGGEWIVNQEAGNSDRPRDESGRATRRGIHDAVLAEWDTVDWWIQAAKARGPSSGKNSA